MKNFIFISLIFLIIVFLTAGLIFWKNSNKIEQPSIKNESAVTATIDESKNTLDFSLNQPTDGQIFTVSQITVSGKTDANAEVSVNDKDIKADSQGEFSTVVNLDEGDNIISILANDEYGNMAEKEIVVSYTP